MTQKTGMREEAWSDKKFIFQNLEQKMFMHGGDVSFPPRWGRHIKWCQFQIWRARYAHAFTPKKLKKIKKQKKKVAFLKRPTTSEAAAVIRNDRKRKTSSAAKQKRRSGKGNF